MDTNFMRDLTLSMVIFAPGVVLLGMGLLMGVLVALEKAGVLATVQKARLEKAELRAGTNE